MGESRFAILFYGEWFAPYPNREDFDSFEEAKRYAVEAFGKDPETARNTEIIEVVGKWKGPDFGQVNAG